LIIEVGQVWGSHCPNRIQEASSIDFISSILLCMLISHSE